MPKIKLSSKSKQGSWMDNLQRLFEFRISRLRIGDALISDDGQWRVDCLRDPDNQDRSYFVVSQNGRKLVQRKKANTIIKFLVRSKADPTMKNYENSAIFLLSGFYRFTTSGNPRIEIEVEMDHDIEISIDEPFWDGYLSAKSVSGDSIAAPVWNQYSRFLPEVSIIICFSDSNIDILD